jgi:acyl carrier protein
MNTKGSRLTASEIFQRLTDIFRDVFDDSTIALKPELTAKDLDQWDSLTHVRLVLAVEKGFGVNFTAAEVGGLNNVGDLLALIESKL